MPAQAYRVSNPAASVSSNSGGEHPGGHQMRPPSRPVSTVPSMNNEDNSVVPGGTNVISGYDPATVRAMNLSRAENLLSQKHQKYYPPPPASSQGSSYRGGSDQGGVGGGQGGYPSQHSPASSSSSDMPPMRGATHPHAQMYLIQQQQQQQQQQQIQMNGNPKRMN